MQRKTIVSRLKSRKQKPKRGQLDARQVYDHANSFVEADWLIRNQSDKKARIREMSAQQMLSAFAIELLLKCILIIEKKTPPDTHRLYGLFRRLNQRTKQRLEGSWNTHTRPNNVAINLRENRDAMPLDLPTALRKSADLFVTTRYLYEDPKKWQPLLFGFTLILAEYIYELKPHWGRVVYRLPSPDGEPRIQSVTQIPILPNKET
jgi:hypothetical protein